VDRAESGAFTYVDYGSAPGDSENDWVAIVPEGISTRDQLFNVLRRELQFPAYFGDNWDALADCLRDLSWIDRYRVIIAHAALPVLDNSTLLKYLEVLAECVNDWKPGEQHRLNVLFPKEAKEKVSATLG
jgi:RNAse (barnase) inhibitor barstar